MTVHSVEIEANARVELEFDIAERYWYRSRKSETVAEHAARLRKCCKEFETFLRDHRCQDEVTLTVVTDRIVVCSGCERAWDPDEGRCGYCGESIDTEDTNVQQF